MRPTCQLPPCSSWATRKKACASNVLKRATRELTIPLARPFDSLNVAQAAAMVIAEFARRQQ